MKKRLSSNRRASQARVEDSLDDAIQSLVQLKTQIAPICDKLAKASASFHSGCQSMRYVGADMIEQGEIIAQQPDNELLGNLLMRVGKQVKTVHELMNSMSKTLNDSFGISVEKKFTSDVNSLVSSKKNLSKQKRSSKLSKRRSQLSISVGTSEDIQKNTKMTNLVEKNLEEMISATELEWTKKLCNGLLASSASFLELFQNGEKSFRRCEEENNELQVQLNIKLEEKKQQSSGKPQMFRRVDSSDKVLSNRASRLTIGGSREPAEPQGKKLSRRRSCRFDNASFSSRNFIADEKSPRVRPLSFHLRVSSPDLKAAMLQAAPEKISTKTNPITQEEVQMEREITQCDDDAYAILLKLILRESFYQKRLNIIIENFMIPLTFDPWRNRIKPEEFKCIFRNITSLRDIHVEISKQLEECKQQWETNLNPGHSLVLLIANIVEKLYIYKEYNSGATDAIETLDTCYKRSKNLHSFVMSCQKTETAEESLTDLLEYPVHVLPSYKSTLELVMVTQVNTDEEELLERTFHLLSQYQKDIETETEKRKQTALVKAIEDKIQGYIFSEETKRQFLSKTSAIVTMENSFSSVEDLTLLKPSKMSLLLFNDILLLTKQNKQRLNAIRDGGKENFKFLREIKLFRTQVEKKDNNTIVLTEREHADLEYKFSFQFSTTEKFNDFLKSIEQAFEFIDSRKVFGISLEKLMNNSREDGLIPSIIDKTVRELLKRGAHKTEGLLRISGNASTMLSFLNLVNQGGPINLTALDVHTIAGLFKLFFRRMPEPIMTYQRFDEFLSVTEMKSETEKIIRYRELISQLPDVSQFTLQHIFSFFNLMATYSNVNKMTETNIAIVMAPVLLHSEVNDMLAASRQCIANEVIEDIIRNYKAIYTEISVRRKALEHSGLLP